MFYISIFLSLLILLMPFKEAISKDMPEKVQEDLVFIKGGCFEMGDIFGDGEVDETPVHEVCVDDFYAGKYEVTVGEFKKFVEDTGYKTEAERGNGCANWEGEKWSYRRDISWRNPNFLQTDRDPVVCISWNDVMEYIKWRSKVENKNYRLLTEAEWEYAAKSGKSHKYSWGSSEPSGNIADLTAKRKFPNWIIWEGYDDGYVFTSPVGSFRPNEFGLFDMTGNVWEWVSDLYDKTYYSKSPKQNPKGPENGTHRIARGGSWINFPWFLRITYRDVNEPDDRCSVLGFRIALSADK